MFPFFACSEIQFCFCCLCTALGTEGHSSACRASSSRSASCVFFSRGLRNQEGSQLCSPLITKQPFCAFLSQDHLQSTGADNAELLLFADPGDADCCRFVPRLVSPKQGKQVASQLSKPLELNRKLIERFRVLQSRSCPSEGTCKRPE